MEDWKLTQQQQSDVEIAGARSRQESKDEDPVEQIHRRRSSMKATNSMARLSLPGLMHTIPIESRYIVSPDDENDLEPDIFLRNTAEAPHTLMEKQCIAQDVINIWEAISEYIILKLKRGYGTIIPGLGTFTYLIKNVSIPKKQICKLHIYPKFFLSEYVAEMYKLEQDSSHHSNVPCKLINLSVLAKRINIPRPIIEGAVTEVLQAFARGIVCSKNIEFPFPCIGKLHIANQCVRMRFYLNFYKNLKYNIEVPSALIHGNVPFEEPVIEGQMTPLVHHIPQPNYRSVFHLREVRSVHDKALLAPVEYHKGRLIPKTLLKNEEEKEMMYDFLGKEDKSDSGKSDGGSSPEEAPSMLSHMGPPSIAPSLHSEMEEIMEKEKEGNKSLSELPESIVGSALSRFSGTESDLDEAEFHYIYNPKPLYLEQVTGIEILDKRVKSPDSFTKELEKFVIGDCIEHLGSENVFAHLRRTLLVRPKQYVPKI